MLLTVTTFPKLYHVRSQNISAPGSGSWYRQNVLEFHFSQIVLFPKSFTWLYFLRLVWGPSSNLSSSWPLLEVGIRFLTRNLLYFAFYSYTTFQFSPPELDTGVRVAGKVFAFLRVVVCVPDKWTILVVKFFKQHVPWRWSAPFSDCRQAHGVGLCHFVSDGLIDPCSEEFEWLTGSWYVAFVNGTLVVLFSHLCEILSGCCCVELHFWDEILRQKVKSQCIVLL